MLNNEIQGASIIGCPNPPILGGPCTKVTLVFPYTLTQHKVNNKRAVLQMGLIGVSNKGYPILAIPKKNKIQFSPLKLPSNPLPKIEYQRNQWEGMGEGESKCVLLPQTKIPSWRKSEKDIAKTYPDYTKQKSFLNGKEVPYGTKGSVRPDFYKSGSSIEVKNYKLNTKSQVNNLVGNIVKQYEQRLENLPPNTKQIVIIDIRGQNISSEILKEIRQKLHGRTNNGILIKYKLC